MILYLAGGVFNAGERLHNLYLEKYLKKKGYEIVLPQREALQFLKDGAFDVLGVSKSCRNAVTDKQNICVMSADGMDADSGAAIEFGIAITATGKAVVYRTDFRTALEKELGVNGMLRLEGSTFVYKPCFFTRLDEVDAYYEELSEALHQAILNLK